MSNNLSVSFIIPVYNSVDTLVKTVASIRSCNYQNYEIILIDDGSKDLTWNLCKQIQSQYTNVRAFHQENTGASSARNYGIRVASKKFVAFVDSDDVICSWNLPSSVLGVNPDLIIGGMRTIRNNHEENNALSTAVVSSEVEKREVISDLIQHDLFNSLCNKFYLRSKIFEQIREDVLIGEDFWFNLSFLTHATKIVTVHAVFYEYRVRRDSLTHSFHPHYLNEINHVDAARLRLLTESHDSDWSDHVYLSDLYSLVSLISTSSTIRFMQGVKIIRNMNKNSYSLHRLKAIHSTCLQNKYKIFRLIWLFHLVWLLFPVFKLRHVRQERKYASQ